MVPNVALSLRYYFLDRQAVLRGSEKLGSKWHMIADNQINSAQLCQILGMDRLSFATILGRIRAEWLDLHHTFCVPECNLGVTER
jgi:hypothetical protein